ncbi:sulfatase family protein [Novipirellula artificiosorum]|uniref:Arylsulfatase n=1 Tax=Novipirellula artificiosorum TaxID=2528016 RepID=A0A5C6DYY1_9BACT|nr:sulfatase-like hydrolase/transferase [Novipirellula artificiosorum]TWU40621.1 Arylsulfatase [Novipirellula artificiosorum]
MKPIQTCNIIQSAAVGLVAALVATTAFSRTCAAEETSVVQPNILFIITDQQYIEAMSAAGNPYVKTPAMDSLAARGMRFTKSYCTYPVCTPSRASLVTSLMPHEMGILSNNICPGIPQDIPNMGDLFRKAGYRTAWAGKWHVPAPYPGFMTGPRSGIPGFDVLKLDGPVHRSIPSTGPGMGSDPTTTKATLDFLDQPQDRPFLLVCSLLNPHDICEYPREPDNYPAPPAASKLPPLPANFEAIQNEPSLLAAVRQRQQKAKVGTRRDTEIQWREYRWAYYHLTEVVDSLISQVLKKLDQSPYADNTLIIFTSDHGEMAGSHQLRTKSYMYEEATAVPLIVCPPIKTSAAVDKQHLVSGLDILPTMCDYAGISIPESFEGVSLRPLLENTKTGRQDAWRDYLVLEINDRTEVRMVRSDRYKYIVYAKGEIREQLFDLESDPGETSNLAQNPERKEIIETHRNMLRQWIHQTKDTFVLPETSGSN